jgi:hypothetical protein
MPAPFKRINTQRNKTMQYEQLKQYLTSDNAYDYSMTTDKIALCSDITGLRIDSPLVERFENDLEKLANELGYMEDEDTDEPQKISLADAYAQFDEMLDECHPMVNVCGYEYSPSHALRQLDPIAYRCGFSDYCSMLESEHGIIVE